MALTALDIQQQRFRTKVRGLDPKEVQAFLEQAAAAFEDLQRENHRLTDEDRQLRGEIEEHRKREGTFKRALMQSQKVLDQMTDNAEKQADLIVAEAENKAEKLLHTGAAPAIPAPGAHHGAQASARADRGRDRLRHRVPPPAADPRPGADPGAGRAGRKAESAETGVSNTPPTVRTIRTKSWQRLTRFSS